MENISRVFQKQKPKKLHEEIELHNSIQGWVFTTVYQLQKSAWKNACFTQPFCTVFHTWSYFMKYDRHYGALMTTFLTNPYFILSNVSSVILHSLSRNWFTIKSNFLLLFQKVSYPNMFSRPNFQMSIRLTVIGRIAPSTRIFINNSRY